MGKTARKYLNELEVVLCRIDVKEVKSEEWKNKNKILKSDKS